MGPDPETTAHLLPHQGRTSVDTISFPDEPQSETYSLEGGDASSINAWGEDGNHSRENSVSARRMILLTCGTFGLQNVWSLLLANGTPYLLSLGFSRSTTALIWIAGPLTGTFVQPFIGAISDQSTYKWGKRKPFIVAGITGAVLSMMSMALMRIGATKIYIWFGRDYISVHAMGNIARTLVIFWVCILNLSLQPIQVGLRALVIDGCPTHQQSQASAWSGRFTGMGSISTYLLDDFLIRRYPNSTFEVLCIITSLSLIITNLPCLILASERVPHPAVATRQTSRPKELTRRLLRTTKRMSPNLRRICAVQFASWCGWFPFLYYNTTYISALDVKMMQNEKNHPNSSGVQAYLFFAVIAFYCAIVLPWIKPTPLGSKLTGKTTTLSQNWRREITLPRLWQFSQILFAVLMFSTILITSSIGGIVVVAIAGICWSITQWVPLAMMSAEIASMREAARFAVEGDGEDETGSLMSLFNVAISAPQILAGTLCSALFWIIGGGSAIDSLGWALRMGGVASVISAFLMIGLRS